jgi:hypothetical protein
MGKLIYNDPAHLRGPLGLVLAPNGDLIATNGDAVNGDPTQPSELVEFTPSGKFVGQFSIDPGQGSAFGLAISNDNGVLRLAAVNDDTNKVEIWTFSTSHKNHEHHHDDHEDHENHHQDQGDHDDGGRRGRIGFLINLPR